MHVGVGVERLVGPHHESLARKIPLGHCHERFREAGRSKPRMRANGRLAAGRLELHFATALGVWSRYHLAGVLQFQCEPDRLSCNTLAPNGDVAEATSVADGAACLSCLDDGGRIRVDIVVLRWPGCSADRLEWYFHVVVKRLGNLDLNVGKRIAECAGRAHEDLFGTDEPDIRPRLRHRFGIWRSQDREQRQEVHPNNPSHEHRDDRSAESHRHLLCWITGIIRRLYHDWTTCP